MNRSGPCKFYLEVYGDWSQVIAARAYFEKLINQKPDSEEDDHNRYRIEVKSLSELVEAHSEFSWRRNLRCELTVSARGDNISNFSASLGDGKSEFHASFQVDDNRLLGAIRAAREVLEDATK